jgi:hypothetical protein
MDSNQKRGAFPGSANVRRSDEAPDTRQMLHDMKTEARKMNPYEYFAQGPLPTRGAEPGEPGGPSEETPRISREMFFEPIPEEEQITSESMKLASGVYDGAGGYEYEVMPGGEIKILKAPKNRGVGITLKIGHPAHEAIFDELSESGASPKTKPSEPAEEPDAFGTTMAARKSREQLGGVRAGETKAGETKEAADKAMAKKE